MNFNYDFFGEESDIDTYVKSEPNNSNEETQSTQTTSRVVRNQITNSISSTNTYADLFNAHTIPEGVIHALDGKYYMDVDFIIHNPSLAAEVAKQHKIMSQQKAKPVLHTHSGKEFHWTQDLSKMFAVACSAFGIKKVTPKQLQAVLPFEISRESVGSHLQKYRLKLLKLYNLSSTHDIQNQHLPNIEDPKIIMLRRLWADPQFNGYSTDDVKRLIEQ
ncbi:Conserved_hypothetical protein [Hexamita inflata]|uniref:Myb-like domain-containing protein n=1 Tax=Hexamita inflata TaxID=28002 RepID=A0AA86ULT9_9EUKA|nr:Conserved hypothetical protein [Hexamita inflata]CAI9956367.1 Conserved hypothetical protein [Hexamita inflata]CAI9963865.1 Conserved hypothetical protein [Hexamita inflata]